MVHIVPTSQSFASPSVRHFASSLPIVMVTCPAARAVSIGGSSGERRTMVGSLEAQVSPVTGCESEFSAFENCAIGLRSRLRPPCNWSLSRLLHPVARLSAALGQQGHSRDRLQIPFERFEYEGAVSHSPIRTMPSGPDEPIRTIPR